jgi:hypothetical protein
MYHLYGWHMDVVSMAFKRERPNSSPDFARGGRSRLPTLRRRSWVTHASTRSIWLKAYEGALTQPTLCCRCNLSVAFVSHHRGALHAARLVNNNDLQAACPAGTDSRLDSMPRRSGRLKITSAGTSTNKRETSGARCSCGATNQTPGAMIGPGAAREFQFPEYADLRVRSSFR